MAAIAFWHGHMRKPGASLSNVAGPGGGARRDFDESWIREGFARRRLSDQIPERLKRGLRHVLGELSLAQSAREFAVAGL